MQRASPLAREALLSAAVAGAFAALLVWIAPPGNDLAAHVLRFDFDPGSALAAVAGHAARSCAS